MRVQILGSGGYFPSEHRHTACYFLPDSSAVFDAGTGAFRLLDRLTTSQLNLFVSHAHLDHIVGLTYLLLPMAQGRLEKVRLYGTDPTLKAIQTHLFSKPVFPVMPEFTFCPLDDHAEVQLADGACVTHHPLTSHPGGSTAFRVDWPAGETERSPSMAYVTDTTVDGSYAEFISGVDLLLHECYFNDAQAEWAVQTGHSHTTQVTELARSAGVGRLVMIHVDPQGDVAEPIDLGEARRVFSAASVAEDLQELTL